MKKQLFLTMAVGAVTASNLMAQSDVFITGSTAFRKQVYSACQKLFTGTPTIYTGTLATGGDTGTGSGAGQWTMTGTPITALTNLSSPLTIHGSFSGSVQGCYSVESQEKLIFLSSSGVAVTNTPTIAFSDVSSASTPYPATGNYSEESVAVQPFVYVRSVPLTSQVTMSNVANEQIKYAVQAGRIPLSAWDNQSADHANYVYLINRTQDSGTRRTAFSLEYDAFITPQVIYNYDATNNVFFKCSSAQDQTAQITGTSSAGVVGLTGNYIAGLGGFANCVWGAGYVGGGDIKTELGYNNAANQAISYLSMADAQGITSKTWSQVMSYDGVWPTAAGAAITSGTTTTNDFSPIVLGYYPYWATEVVVYPNADQGFASDQDINSSQLGNQQTPGTFLGVLDYQTKISGGSLVTGSLENEIQLSKSISPGATAIRLSDMTSSRQAVGGTIAP